MGLENMSSQCGRGMFRKEIWDKIFLEVISIIEDNPSHRVEDLGRNCNSLKRKRLGQNSRSQQQLTVSKGDKKEARKKSF